jgi:hypothetical protein
MSFTPKHLKLTAGGMPSGDFVNNPLEGCRTQGVGKITQKQPARQKPDRNEERKKNTIL